jgi:hypothetical protein
VAGYHFEDAGGTTEFRTLAEHFTGTRFDVPLIITRTLAGANRPRGRYRRYRFL